MVSVDLKLERRVVCHTVQEGNFKAMVQTRVGDHELACDELKV